jgi:hypothetical protein
MGRPRKYTDAQLIAAVPESFSIRRVLQRIGLTPTGANYAGIQARFVELGLDVSRLTGRAHRRGETHDRSSRRPLRDQRCRAASWIHAVHRDHVTTPDPCAHWRLAENDIGLELGHPKALSRAGALFCGG